jgi:hypothetical protein
VEGILIEKAFRLQNSSLTEYHGPTLGNNQEAPPATRQR